MDLKTLERLTVSRLRDEASRIPDLGDMRSLTRERLIRAIAIARKIDISQRRRGGATKTDVKKQIRELQSKIVEALHEKRQHDVKRLRFQKKRLKALTRGFGREKPTATPAVETPTV